MGKLHSFIIAISFLIFSLCISAQEFSLKYGKVTEDELNMTVYEKDTTAAAVVIYEDGDVSYRWGVDDFQVCYQIKKKIKILKQEGTDKATVTIPYYYKSNREKDVINGLEAYAYNFENGKIEKTKLDKKYVFDEEVGGNTRQMKFSIPNVKAGTVIEYKYEILSPYYYDLNEWNMQSDIPVMNSKYEVLIPEYFIFNLDMKGFERVNTEEKQENQQFIIRNGGESATIRCTSRNIKFSATDLPAMKNEPYVWCKQDFTSSIRFELQATNFPYDFYRPYTRNWESIDKLLDESSFGSNIKTSNPYKEEVKVLLEGVASDKEKIELIYAFAKTKMRWNETYAFWGKDAKNAVKNGTGDNSQINIILMSMLKDAGINAYPVLISRRSKGRLPFTHPSVNKLNTFIVAAECADGTRYYMDGSAMNGGLNMLPIDLLVDRARVYSKNVKDKWVDLTNIAKNRQNSLVKVEITESAQIKGEASLSYTNQLAYRYKNRYSSAKDSATFTEEMIERRKIELDSLSIEGHNPMSNIVKERLLFTKNLNKQGDYIYMNPMIFLHLSENEFTQTERKLPIEFNYPYLYSQNVFITIPQNYEIEEIPKSMHLVLDEDKMRCVYQVQQNGNVLQVSYRFELNQLIFPQTDYDKIVEFFGKVAEKNNEMIVLKKL